METPAATPRHRAVTALTPARTKDAKDAGDLAATYATPPASSSPDRTPRPAAAAASSLAFLTPAADEADEASSGDEGVGRTKRRIDFDSANQDTEDSAAPSAAEDSNGQPKKRRKMRRKKKKIPDSFFDTYEPPKPPPLSKRRLSERQQIYLLSHPELLEKLLAEKDEEEAAKATAPVLHETPAPAAEVSGKPAEYADWDEAQRQAWDAVETNPNVDGVPRSLAYYYHYTHPGVKPAQGKWTPAQHDLFQKTLQELGPPKPKQWGLFARHMKEAGRSGKQTTLSPWSNAAQCRNYYRHLQSQGLVPETSESEDQPTTAPAAAPAEKRVDATEQHAAQGARAAPAAAGTVPAPAPAAAAAPAPVAPSPEITATEEESDKENEPPEAPEPKRPARRDRKRAAGPTTPSAAAVSDRAASKEATAEEEDEPVEDVGTDDVGPTGTAEDDVASAVLPPASSDEEAEAGTEEEREEELSPVVPRRSPRGWRKAGEPTPSLPQRTPSPLAAPSSPIESSPRGLFVPVVLPAPVPRPPPKVAWETERMRARRAAVQQWTERLLRLDEGTLAPPQLWTEPDVLITFGWSAQRQLMQRQQQERATLALCQALQRDRLLRTCANSLRTIVERAINLDGELTVPLPALTQRLAQQVASCLEQSERIAWQHREEATTLATVQLAEWTPNLVSAAWPGPPVWLVETATDADVLQSMLADDTPLL